MSIPDQAQNDGAQNAGNESASQGPPADLPDAAPGFVGDIHEAINDFLANGTDVLGDIVSEIASQADPSQAATFAVDIAAVIPV